MEKWKNAEENGGTNQKDLIKYIVDNIETLKKDAPNNPQKVLDDLNAKLVSGMGIGTVNLINLLYFLSKGEKPIYDKYAFVAINVICDGRSPKTSEKKPIKYSEPPDKSSKEFRTICEEGVYKDYCDMIDAVFGIENYKKNRDIDRALWAYGHEFVIK